MRTQALIAHLEHTAPLHLAASWDKSGVQIAAPDKDIVVLGVALDPVLATVQAALEAGCDFLLCHHPLTLSPRLPNRLDDYHQILSLCLGASLCLYSAHTSLDANPAGPVNWLGKHLGLQDMKILEPTSRETPVMVRFKASDAAEMPIPGLTRCDNGNAQITLWPEELEAMRQQLREASTDGLLYEAKLDAPVREYGFGAIGKLPQPLLWSDFSACISAATGNSRIRLVGKPPQSVSTVAYCPGSGADLAPTAFRYGADVFITGDMKFHQAQAVMQQGLVMDVGHFSLEENMMRTWSRELENILAPTQIRVVFLPGVDPFF